MSSLLTGFGGFVGSLVELGSGSVVLVLLIGLLSGRVIHDLIGVPIIQAGKEVQARGGWIPGVIVSILLITFILQWGIVNFIAVWPLWVTAAVLSLLFFRTKLGFLGFAGSLILINILLVGLLFWTFHAFTGKTAVLIIEIQKVDEEQITLRLTDIKRDESRTMEITGDKWGISANVALVDDWVVLLGGKTYYRLNSVVSRDGEYLHEYPLDKMTDGMWDELEQYEDRLPGMRAVYEDIVLKVPYEGRKYTLYMDNDGSLVPELE